MSEKRIVVGMAGNPNVGKSAIFNALTGSRQHVGNWPGKTIERAEGVLHHGDWDIHLVDLPGTYSLAAQSPEEIVARDYILSGEPDVVVNVVDATSLERNLNLTLQILELTDRVVVALNLMDEVKRQGWEIDVNALEAALGVPVMPTVAVEGEGLSELAEAIVAVTEGRRQTHPVSVDYGLTIEGYVQNLEVDLARLGIACPGQARDGWRRWAALRLLEDDPEIVEAFKGRNLSDCFLREDGPSVSPEALQAVLNRAVRLREATHPDARVEIVRRRYELAHEVTHQVARRLRPVAESLTERVDRIVTHRVWSWPIMLTILVAVLWVTIQGANIPSSWLEEAFGWLARVIRDLLLRVNAPWWVIGPLVDGLIVGTGTVIAVMLPPMVIFFTAFNLLEDVGFIPRVAFNLDRLMRAVMIAAPATLLIWLLGNLPPGAPFEQTAVGHLVGVLGPLGRPFGLTGEMLTALLFTLPAKEIVVSSLAMTYGLQTTLVGSEAVLSHLAQTWTPLVAFSFLTFYMLYMPCLVTVWATWKETHNLKWTLVGILVPLVTASAITVVVFQGGRLLGFS